MATRTQVPVEEYLRMSFEGADREYVDGEVLERNVGGNIHSKTQVLLVEFFSEIRKSRRLFTRTEIRLRVAAQKYRVADLAIFAGEDPTEEVPSQKPLLIVEIVSPDDRLTDIVQKLDEYRQWGTPNVWLVDPYLRKLYVYDDKGLKEVTTLELNKYGVQLSINDLV